MPVDVLETHNHRLATRRIRYLGMHLSAAIVVLLDMSYRTTKRLQRCPRVCETPNSTTPAT